MKGMVRVKENTGHSTTKLRGNKFDVMLTTDFCIILCFSPCYVKTKKLKYKNLYIYLLLCVGVKIFSCRGVPVYLVFFKTVDYLDMRGWKQRKDADPCVMNSFIICGVHQK
jgi:hypothetical protein